MCHMVCVYGVNGMFVTCVLGVVWCMVTGIIGVYDGV